MNETSNRMLARYTWAAKSWSQRATWWLHVEPHDLELDGKDVVYHPAGYENGFAIRARTLSQMDVRPSVEFHIKNAMRLLDKL